MKDLKNNKNVEKLYIVGDYVHYVNFYTPEIKIADFP